MEKETIENENDVLLKIYNESLKEYRQRYNWLTYSSYVVAFVGTVVTNLVFEIFPERDTKFAYPFFWFMIISFLIGTGLLIAFFIFCKRQYNTGSKAKNIAEKIEEKLFVERKLRLIHEIREGGTGSCLSYLVPIVALVYWVILWICIIFPRMV
ncbi:MAG: hypothetical protein MOIL_01386 [Candidatus Methanolliviera sp. GoM_oil]|nr:MAG: hypothetical protein MOIL_01386 [Candidatus Methanolliviera sp. GoM_oil]